MKTGKTIPKSTIAMFILLLLVCSCSVTIYTQYKPINSHQKIESSSNTSADSAAVNVQFPK